MSYGPLIFHRTENDSRLGQTIRQYEFGSQNPKRSTRHNRRLITLPLYLHAPFSVVLLSIYRWLPGNDLSFSSAMYIPRHKGLAAPPEHHGRGRQILVKPKIRINAQLQTTTSAIYRSSKYVTLSAGVVSWDSRAEMRAWLRTWESAMYGWPRNTTGRVLQ